MRNETDRVGTTPAHKGSGARQPKGTGYLAVLLATACWGSSGIWVEFVVETTGISALPLAFWRDLVTFLVLFLGVRLLHPAWLVVNRRDVRWLAGLGASLGTFHVFWNLGVLLNGPAVATVQQAAMPAIVAIVASVIWDEPLTARKVIAIILTFVGTVLVSGVDVLGEADLTLSGFLVGLGIPIAYAAWNLFGKKVRGDYNAVTTLTYGFGFGAMVLLPFQFFRPQPWPVSSQAALWFAGLIGVATILAFVSYTFALGHLQASVASILAMAEIPIVAVYAYVLLGDRMTLDEVVGAALVIAGVLMLSWPESGAGEAVILKRDAEPEEAGMVTKTLPMELLDQRGIPYDVHQHEEDQYSAEGVADDLGVDVAQVVKAMLVRCDGSWYVLVVIPGDRRLDLEKVRTTVGAGKVNLASKQEVERVTGYRVGAVSVLGIRQGGVLAFVDRGVLGLDHVVISSGRPDAGLGVSVQDLLGALEGAQVGDFCE